MIVDFIADVVAATAGVAAYHELLKSPSSERGAYVAETSDEDPRDTDDSDRDDGCKHENVVRNRRRVGLDGHVAVVCEDCNMTLGVHGVA